MRLYYFGCNCPALSLISADYLVETCISLVGCDVSVFVLADITSDTLVNRDDFASDRCCLNGVNLLCSHFIC